MGIFSGQLILEVTRGRDKEGNLIVDQVEAGAILAGLTVPLIQGMNMKDLIGSVQTGDDGAVSGYTHGESIGELRPAGMVEAFTRNEDGTRTITRFRLAAVSAT